MKLRDRINNFEQLTGESVSAAWERFSKYIRSAPNHRIIDDSLLEHFFRGLDDNGKAVADTVTGGAFLMNTFVKALEKMDRVAKTNRAWSTRDSETTKSSFSTKAKPSSSLPNEELLQEIAQLRIDLQVAIKNIGHEKVNTVDLQGREPSHDDYEYEEDAYYMNDQQGVPGLTPKDPIRILGAKVKGIIIGTMEITTVM